MAANEQIDSGRVAAASQSGGYVDTVVGLTSSQGSLALASALFSGFSLAGLSSVDWDELRQTHIVIHWAYTVTTALSITMNLYVCGTCTILEQEGKIAAALFHTKSDPSAYNRQLELWYSQPDFNKFRTRIFWVFALSVPSFALSIAFFFLVKVPSTAGWVAFVIVTIFGVGLFRTYLWVNSMFRYGVLGLKKKLDFSPPSVSVRTEEGVKEEGSLPRTLGANTKKYPDDQV